MTRTALSRNDLTILGALLRSPLTIDFGFLRWEYGADADAAQACFARLQGCGCIVAPSSLSGYRLVRSGLEVWQDYLEFALAEAGAPRQVRVYGTLASTQDTARDWAGPPVAILADEQTAGRGRLGRRWVAPPGSAVLLSLTHGLDSPAAATMDHIQYVAAVAVAQALERLLPRRTLHIKWPNDVLTDGRKLAGILVETQSGGGGKSAVVGIGINFDLPADQVALVPPEIKEKMTTLRELGCVYDRLHVAAEVIANLDRQLTAPHQRLLLDEWRARNLLHQRRCTFQSDGRTIVGEVVDLDPDDGLIVRLDTGELVHLHAATTTVL